MQLQLFNEADGAVMVGIRDIGRLIAKQLGYKHGFYEVVVGLQFGAGAAGGNMNDVVPTAFVGIQRIGLRKVDKPGPLVIDVAEPAAKPTAKKAVAKRAAP